MLKKLREYLSENNLDYLIINTTDEFLVEYNELCNCSRYFVTGFSGSTGDVLLSKKTLWQFVDGRYHEQADNEVDLKTTTVVKLQLGQTYLNELVKRINPDSNIGVVSNKISLNFYKALNAKLIDKNCKIISLETDPVSLFALIKPSEKQQIAENIDTEIAGISADDKFFKLAKRLKTNESYLDTNLENIAYLTNCRQYKTPFASTFKAKMLIKKDKAYIYTNERFQSVIGKYFEILPLNDFANSILNTESVYFNPTTINLYDYNLIEKKAKESKKDFIKLMKSIKTESEIKHFKSAYERTDIVVNTINNVLQNKVYTESELSDLTEKEFLNQGAKQLSFKTILAAGKNSSVIHYSHPSEKTEINNGDFVLLDCGGHFEGGYSTDITRTFVKGQPDKEQKKVYTTVLKMFLNAYNYNVTQRTTGFTLDRIARQIHKKSG